jgi:hypothetical protein
MEKFIALWDLHWGYERRNKHKLPLHDVRAMNVALDFARDFKPDHVILGGDILDAGCVSHHNHGKPGATEGLKLLEDVKGLKDNFIKPLEDLRADTYTYIEGNHEAWLKDLEEMIPALEGMFDLDRLLDLQSNWKVVPQGEFHKLGKCVFVHGDQIRGGIHSAKWAVEAYQANIFFGHFHTHQAHTRVSAIELNGHTGTAVPCLCKKGPGYGGGSPNRWMQGFLHGYIQRDGSFNSYVTIIIDGKAVINGKEYRG